MVQNKPASGVFVVFASVDRSKENAVTASATTDEEGRFALSTYESGDGAPPGDYEVAITWKTDSFQREKGGIKKPAADPDRLKGRYKDPKTSGLRAHVDEKLTELPPFQLQ